MIAIIDYGMGNLRSVQKGLEAVGAEVQITQKIANILQAEKIVLPGVGAMKPAMEQIDALGLIPSIKKSINAGKPFLGICLGFQLLFEESNEGGRVKGLGILHGNVERFTPLKKNSLTRFTQLKVPHMGWNQLRIKNDKCSLLSGIDNLTNVYFCHSYFVKPTDEDAIATTTNYGIDFASSVCKNNIFGVQFHPEKSQTVGLRILKNFAKL